MGYRIRYEVRKRPPWYWGRAAVFGAVLIWGVGQSGELWRMLMAGEGLYEALARFVGGMIRGAH